MEEKLELVRRCTYLIKAYGRDEGTVPRRRIYHINDHLVIWADRPPVDMNDVFAEDDPSVTKGTITLRRYNRMVFNVPHRDNVRPSILKDYMWGDAPILLTLHEIRNLMILEDLAQI